ncbi:MAG: M20/M25/M40 family metallo-hydrolase [Chrysiogenetes bacterium]|nr:M20/M25/M40 family metallo-hydrolase [Chrysiogenetes bacterium]
MNKTSPRPLGRALTLVLLSLVLGACARFGASLPAKLDAKPDTVQLRKDVEYLAAERLEGRGLASQGLEQAAKYLVKRFAEAGLEPGGPEGSYYERFDVVIAKGPGVRTSVAFAVGEPDAPEAGAGKEVVFGVRGYDFVPAGFSSEGEFRAPLVFGGSCSTAAGSDDFEKLDVTGKAVLCLPPASGAATQGHPGPANPDRYRAFNLRQKKAVAVLIISAAKDSEDGEPLPDFRPSPMNTEIGIPVGYVRRSVVERMLASVGDGAIKLQPGPAIDVPEVTVSGQVELMREAISTPNVVGVLRASAPVGKIDDEFALLGAHYDHLGWGGAGSMVPDERAIHPGADDNASGVAVLLEAARLLSAHPERLKRDVYFVAFAGEEEGLLGSAAFVKANKARDFVGMVNLDMVGRLGDKRRLYVFGAPSGKEFTDVVESLASAYDFKLEVSGESYGPSDHASFLAAEVPSVHFFTGAHSDYHRPSDTPEKLNYEGMGDVAAMTARMVLALASDPYRPTWAPDLGAEPKGGEGEGDLRGYGAWFGSVPDFAPVEGGGVRLAAIRPGSPAEVAGVKAGDVLRKLGPHEIRNLYDFTYALRSHQPGETLDVFVEREGKLLKLEVTLGAR